MHNRNQKSRRGKYDLKTSTSDGCNVLSEYFCSRMGFKINSKENFNDEIMKNHIHGISRQDEKQSLLCRLSPQRLKYVTSKLKTTGTRSQLHVKDVPIRPQSFMSVKKRRTKQRSIRNDRYIKFCHTVEDRQPQHSQTKSLDILSPQEKILSAVEPAENLIHRVSIPGTKTSASSSLSKSGRSVSWMPPEKLNKNQSVSKVTQTNFNDCNKKYSDTKHLDNSNLNSFRVNHVKAEINSNSRSPPTLSINNVVQDTVRPVQNNQNKTNGKCPKGKTRISRTEDKYTMSTSNKQPTYNSADDRRSSKLTEQIDRISNKNVHFTEAKDHHRDRITSGATNDVKNQALDRGDEVKTFRKTKAELNKVIETHRIQKWNKINKIENINDNNVELICDISECIDGPRVPSSPYTTHYRDSAEECDQSDKHAMIKLTQGELLNLQHILLKTILKKYKSNNKAFRMESPILKIIKEFVINNSKRSSHNDLNSNPSPQENQQQSETSSVEHQRRATYRHHTNQRNDQFQSDCKRYKSTRDINRNKLEKTSNTSPNSSNNHRIREWLSDGWPSMSLENSYNLTCSRSP